MYLVCVYQKTNTFFFFSFLLSLSLLVISKALESLRDGLLRCRLLYNTWFIMAFHTANMYVGVGHSSGYLGCSQSINGDMERTNRQCSVSDRWACIRE